MKKCMCFLITLVLAIGVLCQPISALDGLTYQETVYACTGDGYLNVRSSPTTKENNILTYIADCHAFDVYAYDGKWAYGESYTEQGGIRAKGWIHLNHTKKTYESARDNAGKAINRAVVVQSYQNDGFMNLRRAPTAENGNEICHVSDGTVLQVTRKVQKTDTDKWGWGLVSYNGYKGWIYLKGVKDYVAPTPTPTVESTPVPTPVPTMEPQQMPTGREVGTINMESERLISGNLLVMVLIGVAIFLVVAVAILLIVVLNRSKKEQNSEYDNPYEQQNPYYENYPQNQEQYYDNQQQENAYYDNGTPNAYHDNNQQGAYYEDNAPYQQQAYAEPQYTEEQPYYEEETDQQDDYEQ
ncbi:MAG: hypothetical protein IJC78_02190 [Clostridia bacterium]|nr:hypothetical protein [Clostridia bacterium]